MAGLRWSFIVVPLLAACIAWLFWQSLPSNEQMGLPPVGAAQTEQGGGGGVDADPGLEPGESVLVQPGAPG
ncbi:MAG: hypothetical protein AB7E55_04870 [Pigmentiphaga sp.]